ncbi:hypothetical protein BK380_01585 [Escherichia coli]|uniref:ead/Ea22-like family protein n=1 Tax=Escherichia coli TaxID=562 RepID=UPI00092C04E0|nr:ead/Ea22-like family protein [Escherichia coli]OJR41024.1 hypothetical protein BK380_01585 [Escherichia coli]
MSNIDKRELRHSAESIISILENIAGFEPSDIDGDSVELRFETEDGFDTGCDVSIVDQCQKTADVVRALLDELEAAEKRIAELEARGILLPERSSMLHRTDFHEDYQTVMAYRVSEVIDAIRAAGIRIKGE